MTMLDASSVFQLPGVTQNFHASVMTEGSLSSFMQSLKVCPLAIPPPPSTKPITPLNLQQLRDSEQKPRNPEVRMGET